MGINIYLKTVDGAEHPDWDASRYADDREFPAWTVDLDREYERARGDDPWEASLFRPVDFAAWRAALPPERHNPDRFPRMFDLLEADERYWIYYSF
jgi:hypothetical protein